LNVRKKPRNRSGQLRAMVGSHGPIVIEAGPIAKCARSELDPAAEEPCGRPRNY
jgi:hypothetical protein